MFNPSLSPPPLSCSPHLPLILNCRTRTRAEENEHQTHCPPPPIENESFEASLRRESCAWHGLTVTRRGEEEKRVQGCARRVGTCRHALASLPDRDRVEGSPPTLVSPCAHPTDAGPRLFTIYPAVPTQFLNFSRQAICETRNPPPKRSTAPTNTDNSSSTL